MTNLEYIRTLNATDLADFFYVFWRKEQCKYNDSYGALVWWLEQEHIPQNNGFKSTGQAWNTDQGNW